MTAQEEITALTAQITRATQVEQGAVTFIEGVSTLIANAVAAATANGATTEQLQPLVDLGNSLDSESDALSAAITANTSAAPAPTPAPTDSPDPSAPTP